MRILWDADPLSLPGAPEDEYCDAVCEFLRLRGERPPGAALAEALRRSFGQAPSDLDELARRLEKRWNER